MITINHCNRFKLPSHVLNRWRRLYRSQEYQDNNLSNRAEKRYSTASIFNRSYWLIQPLDEKAVDRCLPFTQPLSLNPSNRWLSQQNILTVEDYLIHLIVGMRLPDFQEQKDLCISKTDMIKVIQGHLIIFPEITLTIILLEITLSQRSH